MGPTTGFGQNWLLAVKPHKTALQKLPLKIGTKMTHIGPNFQICITFDLLMRFGRDRNMLEVWCWSLWPRAGTPSICTQTAQTHNFKKIFEKIFFSSIFQKIKRTRMCHMAACMGRSLGDVKDPSLVNLLRQKNLKNFWKFFFKPKLVRKFSKINFLGPIFKEL